MVVEKLTIMGDSYTSQPNYGFFKDLVRKLKTHFAQQCAAAVDPQLTLYKHTLVNMLQSGATLLSLSEFPTKSRWIN